MNEDETLKRETIKQRIKAGVLVFMLLLLIGGSILFFSVADKQYEEFEKTTVGVHIKGAVVNSGYYDVPYGTRVRDLGEIAGGFLDNTDFDGVNLAHFVEDGEEVYFPYKALWEEGAINLNTATLEELMAIEGVGEGTASKIIEYRDKHGKFSSVLELRDTLGDAKYKAIREYVCAT